MQLADPSGIVTENYYYDAYGKLLPSSDTPSTNLLYAGEMWDNNLQQYYLRARWYDPTVGRFNRMDPFLGNNLDPQSIHKYLYCHANPVNGTDPTGLVFWTPYHGIRVHNEIGYHFRQTSINDRLYNRRINTILKKRVPLWGWDRPDLIDKTTAEVYEIKPMGTYIAARAQLGWYLLLLNTYDPQHRVWKPGVTYMPPSMVKIDLMSFAFVHPPQNGVILYEPFDARPIVAFVIAHQLAKLEAHMAMIKVRTVALRVPF